MKDLRQRLQERVAIQPAAEPAPSATSMRDYYQGVLNSVGSVIYTVDRELKITGVNQQWDNFAQANGGEHLTSDRIVGSSLLDQMSGAPLERWKMLCPQLLKGELPRYADEVANQENLEWRNYSLSANPLHDSRGKIIGLTFVATNITQLKKAEHEMFRRLVEIRGLQQVAHTAGSWVDRRKVYKQITADIAHLFNAKRCIIFLWDDESGHLQAQEPAFGLAGRKLAALSLDMGHPADPLSLWPDLEERDYILLNEGNEAPEDVAETSARVDRLAAMMGILRVSGRIHGTVLVAGRDESFTDQDGQLLALFAVPLALSIENVELNRRLLDRTQQLTMTQDELNRMVKLKEAIRMPLSVVRGYLEILLDGVLGPVPEGQTTTLRMILEKTQAINSLVNRISPPRFPYDANRYESIHLAGLMQLALDRWIPTLEETGLQVLNQLPAPYDQESTITGDPDLLFKALNTLLENAVCRSPKNGTIRVSLQKSRDVVYLEIADQGEVIPTDSLLKVWKSKSDSVSGVNGSGGLDLAEVKRIVEGHGGQVWVESAPDQNTTFSIAFRKARPVDSHIR